MRQITALAVPGLILLLLPAASRFSYGAVPAAAGGMGKTRTRAEGDPLMHAPFRGKKSPLDNTTETGGFGFC
jgi:hypothetical protein